jgi:hypothetical protein
MRMHPSLAKLRSKFLPLIPAQAGIQSGSPPSRGRTEEILPPQKREAKRRQAHPFMAACNDTRRQAQRSLPASRRSTAALARGFRPAGSAPGHASWDVDPAHDPGKLALGLDPGVVFRFPDKIMRKTRSSRHGHAAVSPAGRYPPSPVPVQGLHLPHRP